MHSKDIIKFDKKPMQKMLAIVMVYPYLTVQFGNSVRYWFSEWNQDLDIKVLSIICSDLNETSRYVRHRLNRGFGLNNYMDGNIKCECKNKQEVNRSWTTPCPSKQFLLIQAPNFEWIRSIHDVKNHSCVHFKHVYFHSKL